MKKKLVALCLIAVMIVSVMGCGSKTDETTLEKIKSEGTFSYACSGGYPPFNYIDDSGNLIGFDIDIANALAEQMGVTAKGITTDWDGILGGLTGKRFDIIVGSMAITEKRLEEVNFTNPYYYDGAQFFALESAGYNSIEDLVDGKVGVVTGTTFQEELTKYENVTDVLQFDSDIDNFMALGDGRTNGLITSRFVGLQAPEEYNLVPVGALLYTESIGIAVRKDDATLLDELNTALQTIIDNGTYEELSNKYFGTNILATE
ncbi:MAG: transporter substrate-binding domain-containing protein [Lachnotalea sp.]